MWNAIWNDFFRPCGAWADWFSIVPAINRWAIIGRPDGTFFADILRKLREQPNILGDIFAQATPCFNNPVNLKRVIAMIDEEDWSAMDVDVKGAAFEGLLEKAASEGKKGAGQYFTPRPLIQTICKVMKPDPRGNPDFRLCDPACGTGGFLVCAWEWREVDHGFHGYCILFVSVSSAQSVVEPARSRRPIRLHPYQVLTPCNQPFGTKGAELIARRDNEFELNWPQTTPIIATNEKDKTDGHICRQIKIAGGSDNGLRKR